MGSSERLVVDDPAFSPTWSRSVDQVLDYVRENGDDVNGNEEIEQNNHEAAESCSMHSSVTAGNPAPMKSRLEQRSRGFLFHENKRLHFYFHNGCIWPQISDKRSNPSS